MAPLSPLLLLAYCCNDRKVVGWYDEMSVLYEVMDKNKSGPKELPVVEQRETLNQQDFELRRLDSTPNANTNAHRARANSISPIRQTYQSPPESPTRNAKNINTQRHLSPNSPLRRNVPQLRRQTTKLQHENSPREEGEFQYHALNLHPVENQGRGGGWRGWEG